MSEELKVRINNITVGIEQIEPNPWNPKDSIEENAKNNERFETIKKGIVTHGYLMPVTVRKIAENRYQIIDGYHRWRACKELGYKELLINNLGTLTDEVAKALTIVFEKAKVETNPLKEAEVIREIYEILGDYGQMAQLLPYDEKVIQDKVELLDFDWGKFNGENEPSEEEIQGTQQFIFKIKEPDIFDTCNKVLAHIGDERTEAFINLCNQYANSHNLIENEEKDDDVF